jgi:hypothetical protein
MNFSRKALIVTAAAAACVCIGSGSSFAATSSIRPEGAQACNGNTVNWAADYPTYTDWTLGIDASECIGDKGTFNVPSNSTHVFCAGNNNGTFWWKDTANGTSGSHAFSYDHSYSLSGGVIVGADPANLTMDVYKVQITGWTGSAGC